MEYDQVKWRRWTVIAALLCETAQCLIQNLVFITWPSHPTCTSNTAQWYESPCHVLWWSTFCLSDATWYHCTWSEISCYHGYTLVHYSPIRLEWNSFVNLYQTRGGTLAIFILVLLDELWEYSYPMGWTQVNTLYSYFICGLIPRTHLTQGEGIWFSLRPTFPATPADLLAYG